MPTLLQMYEELVGKDFIAPTEDAMIPEQLTAYIWVPTQAATDTQVIPQQQQIINNLCQIGLKF